MNTWFRKVGMGALALTLAGVLGGCNNGDGGGGALVRLFFGINGSGNCTQVIVDVNLDDADAIIARDEFGDVQCVINTVLDNAGCDITFTELENGDLRAVISGCTIPAVVNLFSCLFEDVDISDLRETASAQCDCVNEGCDENPPVCISLDPDPESCEDCDNGIDDDDDGLDDCEDPDCRNAPECLLTTTTSTTSTTNTIETTTTTNTTSTTVTTTTTMGGGEEFNCTITFEVLDDLEFGSLQWDTFYGDAPGEFLGVGGDVECSSLVEGGALPSFNDCENDECTFFPAKDETLISGIIDTGGFEGPILLSECTFRTTIIPEASDFVITVTSASDPDLEDITPLPDVAIDSIDCDGVTTTTTTTLPPDTTTTTEEGPTTTTTTLVGASNFIVTFNLDTAGAPLGALQLSIDYSSATGDFPGLGGDVECEDIVDDVLFAPNDVTFCTLEEDGSTPCSSDDPGNCLACDEDSDCEADDEHPALGTCSVTTARTLRLGLVGSEPFDAPQPLVECQFTGSAGDPPTAADFPIVIEDVTDEDGEPTTATVSVEVEAAP